MRRVLSAVLFLSFAVNLYAIGFDQGVDVSKALQAVQQDIRDRAGRDELKACTQVSMDAKQMAEASAWNRCNFMGLQKDQCLYICRDGRLITMPPAPGMEPTDPRACLQSTEPPVKALQANASEDPLAACKQKCYEDYRRSADVCHEIFDCPPGLPDCLHRAAMAYSYCAKDCEKPQPR
jgi:hypothetical protein